MLKSGDFEEFPIETRKFEFFKNENKKYQHFPPVFSITDNFNFILPMLSTTGLLSINLGKSLMKSPLYQALYLSVKIPRQFRKSSKFKIFTKAIYEEKVFHKINERYLH